MKIKFEFGSYGATQPLLNRGPDFSPVRPFVKMANTINYISKAVVPNLFQFAEPVENFLSLGGT